MWYYFGVHHDPHVRLWVSGMREVRNMQPLAATLVRAMPKPTANPFEVVACRLVTNYLAFGFRERWKTQIDPDPVVSVFVTNDSFPDAAAALEVARNAFPEVWTRFEKLDLSQCKPFVVPSSAPSLNSTAGTAQP